jgi:hypothetical protein
MFETAKAADNYWIRIGSAWAHADGNERICGIAFCCEN